MREMIETDRHIWLKSLTRNIDIVQAEELLDSFDRLEAEETRAKAAVVVNLVSDLNSGVFEQIVNGGGRMSEALKRMILPELGELKELLADKDAEIAALKRMLVEKEERAKLADKDAEIAALKRMLAEKEGQR